MSHVLFLSIVLATVALGACRREVPYEPMKLGANAAPVQQTVPSKL